MIKTSLPILFAALSAVSTSAAFAEECKGSNTATVRCLAGQQETANLAEAKKKFGASWKEKYDKFYAQCTKEIGGPDAKDSDIGGAATLDRAECVSAKIKAAPK